jgi:hypothetical protein
MKNNLLIPLRAILLPSLPSLAQTYDGYTTRLAKALLTGPTPNQLLLANAGGETKVLTHLGTPGANYALDLATNLATPDKWMPQAADAALIGNATTTGHLTFTNSNHLPQGYYRARQAH